MDPLSVNGRHIVGQSGRRVLLRGTCIGGWMNLENFILGFPGSEEALRCRMTEAHGERTAAFFFDRLLDYVFAEEDIDFIRSCGATAIRIPINYRHFESDAAPFRYVEKGFDRLAQIVERCSAHGLYVILDLHACQGWQNPDWHSDNASQLSLLWYDRLYQDRFVGLWEELARRYTGNAAVAGYDLINEPVTNARWGRRAYHHAPDWQALNALYRRTVAAIRRIDPDHIIILEGDYYGSRFDGLEPPFSENLVYSFHDYRPACFGAGAGPGMGDREEWGLANQRESFLSSEAHLFAERHLVPLFAGEFGAATSESSEETAFRLRALGDQMGIFDEFGIHWTSWTYKDIGVMGWVQLLPNTSYLETIRPVTRLKQDLAVDSWMTWLAPTPVKMKVFELADMIEGALADEAIQTEEYRALLAQAVLSGYVALRMQPAYASCFGGLSEDRLDHVLRSFALSQCRPHGQMIELVKKHLNSGRASVGK